MPKTIYRLGTCHACGTERVDTTDDSRVPYVGYDGETSYAADCACCGEEIEMIVVDEADVPEELLAA